MAGTEEAGGTVFNRGEGASLSGGATVAMPAVATSSSGSYIYIAAGQQWGSENSSAMFTLFGDDTASSAVFRYDVEAESFLQLQSLNSTRSWASAAVVGDALYVTGGTQNSLSEGLGELDDWACSMECYSFGEEGKEDEVEQVCSTNDECRFFAMH